jgi:hypothetical protein
MFLKTAKSSDLRAQRQAGSTVLSVIILTTVALVLTTVLGNQIISTFGFTATAKSRIQAELAAEAGLLAVRSELFSKCPRGIPTIPVSTSSPIYQAQVEIFDKPTPQVRQAMTRCPRNGQMVRIVATGSSELPGGIFSDTPAQVTLEEVFEYQIELASGAAGFFGGSLDSRFSFEVDEWDGNQSSPLVISGPNDSSVTAYPCNSKMPHDLILLNNYLVAQSGCEITGDVWAELGIQMTGNAKILGRAQTKGQVLLSDTSSVGRIETDATRAKFASTQPYFLQGANSSAGVIIANGETSIRGQSNILRTYGVSTIHQSAQLGSVILSDSEVCTGADCSTTFAPTSGASVKIPPNKASVEQSLNLPQDSIVFDQTSQTALQTPKDTPRWIRVPHDPNSWLEVGFDQIVPIPLSGAANCNMGTALTNYVANLELKTVFDGFGPGRCGPSGVRGTVNMTLKTDVVFYASTFVLDSLRLRSADNEQRRVWIIVPDDQLPPSDPDEVITPCSGEANEKIQIRALDVDISKVSVFMYSTGLLSIPSETDLRGQLIACNIMPSNSIGSLGTLYSDVMGVPSYNLNDGRVRPNPIQMLRWFRRDLAE